MGAGQGTMPARSVQEIPSSRDPERGRCPFAVRSIFADEQRWTTVREYFTKIRDDHECGTAKEVENVRGNFRSFPGPLRKELGPDRVSNSSRHSAQQHLQCSRLELFLLLISCRPCHSKWMAISTTCHMLIPKIQMIQLKTYTVQPTEMPHHSTRDMHF